MSSPDDEWNPSDEGTLTIFDWYEERDVEAEGMWWLDDLPWPSEEASPRSDKSTGVT